MSPAAADSAAGLVVPIDIVAFCVGTRDPERTSSFAGATVDYSELTIENPQAFLGHNATRGLGNNALQPLETGIHLHWALPDALTRAQDRGATAAFPALPNRWLVTRLVRSGADFTATSFVIASDQLHTHSTSAAAMVIPVKPTNAAMTASNVLPEFEYLGQSCPLAEWSSAPQAVGRSLKAATGFELTVVANGVPSFAAYYPESRNSFGFCDAAADVAAGAELMYVVTGWYDGGVNDPAQIAHTARDRHGKLATLSDTHGWAAVGDPKPAYTLYNGFVAQIAWDPGKDYVPVNPPPIDADIAIANTPSEALAAFFTNALHSSNAMIEQLLTAFQQGLWPKLSQPDPDMLAALAEALHDSQFRKIESGKIYAIYQRIGSEVGEAITLPNGIADALNALNDAAAALLEANNAVATFRWRVFADWYRYFLTQPPAQAQILTHFGQTLAPLWEPDGLSQAVLDAGAARDAAMAALTAALSGRPDLTIRELPGPRYLAPNDPSLLVRANELAMPARYGGDGAHRSDGKLACRATTDIVSKVAINSATRSAADYVKAAALPGGKLPYGADCSALIVEACLLNSAAAAAWSGVAQGQLDTALAALLASGSGAPWTIGAGKAPSPVGVNTWSANPWLPIFLTWEAGYAPVGATGGGMAPYPTDFFTANFSIDPAAGSFVSYTAGQGGIDPAKADYSGSYGGYTILSRQAATNFAKQITDFLKTSTDPTLSKILPLLEASAFMVQPLGGFTDRLLNREALMQVAVVAPPDAKPYATQITTAAAAFLDTGKRPITYHVTPDFDSGYNSIRAGFFNLSASTFRLFAVDAFGQKRPITTATKVVAASMGASPPRGAAEPGFAYAAPRIAQPSRLLFQWISASDGKTAEYNGRPAESPICGWLLPNHLTGGFFLYNGDGRPLGSLFVAGDDTSADSRVVWEGAPGNDADIDQDIETDLVLAAANPQLRALALQLGKTASVDDFNAFYQAVDSAHGSVNPANAATDAGLAVLIGRPVALVQAELRLQLQGPPFLSQNEACLTNNGWTDTDAGLTQVAFPCALGNLDRLDDGLIGFFRQKADGYELGTFFCEASDQSGSVTKADPTTLLLTATPRISGAGEPAAATDVQRVLMLVDPRAPVHAIIGILPTQSLVVPPYLASAAMRTLEFSISSAPVLRASGGLALPMPAEAGFDAAFLEQRQSGDARVWVTLPDIATSVAGALWSYTPQTLTEGWLRFNPTVLTAALLNAAGQPLAVAGATQSMTLRLTNRAPVQLTFGKGAPVPESAKSKPSIFYVHFGKLVAEADVAALVLSSPGWTFTAYDDAIYGRYFAATATADVTLAVWTGPDVATPPPESMIEVTVGGLKAATGLAQAHLALDYYAVAGVSDGVAEATVTINPPPHKPTPSGDER